MKNLILAAMPIVALFSSPVLAQEAGDFTGVKATAIAGYDDFDQNGASVDGFAYGVALGYDRQTSNLVYGVELEATESTTRIKNAPGRIEAGRDFYAGARLGIAASEKALVYIKAGYTNARVSVPGFGGQNGDGYRVGGGVEYKLSDKIFTRAEYRFSNYEAGIERQQALVGMGFKF
ncbi:MAG: porin family protein [Parasphingorhabdus sp.]|uniref:outer membrane protein n=1 Tax=Parasphingorhabdus sp. TaxID=2709688 RepID=UPI003002281D